MTTLSYGHPSIDKQQPAYGMPQQHPNISVLLSLFTEKAASVTMVKHGMDMLRDITVRFNLKKYLCQEVNVYHFGLLWWKMFHMNETELFPSTNTTDDMSYLAYMKRKTVTGET